MVMYLETFENSTMLMHERKDRKESGSIFVQVGVQPIGEGHNNFLEVTHLMCELFSLFDAGSPHFRHS